MMKKKKRKCQQVHVCFKWLTILNVLSSNSKSRGQEQNQGLPCPLQQLVVKGCSQETNDLPPPCSLHLKSLGKKG